jgi:hypothetical protein
MTLSLPTRRRLLSLAAFLDRIAFRVRKLARDTTPKRAKVAT